MRKLNAKQRKILDKIILNHFRKDPNKFGMSLFDAEQGTLEKIRKLNDYETLESDTERYLWDGYNELKRQDM